MRKTVLTLVVLGALAVPGAATAADRCPGSLKIKQGGEGTITYWGMMDGYRFSTPVPRGAPVEPDRTTLPVGAIFTVPEGKSVTYTVRGVKSTFTGPGRWSTYCSYYRRPGTTRRAFLTSHLWGGEISVSGASTTFNDALVTTPEGRIAMTKRARVKFSVSRAATRTVARVGSGGGGVFVTATSGLKNKTPCRTGQSVAIERDGRVHPL